jgi:hypothetical protein
MDAKDAAFTPLIHERLKVGQLRASWKQALIAGTYRGGGMSAAGHPVNVSFAGNAADPPTSLLRTPERRAEVRPVRD